MTNSSQKLAPPIDNMQPVKRPLKNAFMCSFLGAWMAVAGMVALGRGEWGPTVALFGLAKACLSGVNYNVKQAGENFRKPLTSPQEIEADWARSEKEVTRTVTLVAIGTGLTFTAGLLHLPQILGIGLGINLGNAAYHRCVTQRRLTERLRPQSTPAASSAPPPAPR